MPRDSGVDLQALHADNKLNGYLRWHQWIPQHDPHHWLPCPSSKFWMIQTEQWSIVLLWLPTGSEWKEFVKDHAFARTISFPNPSIYWYFVHTHTLIQDDSRLLLIKNSTHHNKNSCDTQKRTVENLSKSRYCTALPNRLFISLTFHTCGADHTTLK